jgi:5-formyltetrahydrofolate cyclo-ligase
MSAATTPHLLRQQKREQRRTLSPAQQRRHAERVTTQLLSRPEFTNTEHIAAYLANDGEINPAEIIEQAWRLGKNIYLPVLSAPGNRLLFAPFEANSSMCCNQFGIDEPDCPPEHRLKAEQMDLILLPLVAFDTQGNRLGMGGGFYDRSLANIRQHERRTQLFGLAHEIQKTEQLEVQEWDVPLDAVVTEADFYTFR